MKGKFVAPAAGAGEPDFSEMVYLGGEFTATAPKDYYPATGILTLNDDATVNGRFEGSTTLFITPSFSTVATCAMQADGKILIGGSYSFNKVYRFNSDGSVDNTFSSGNVESSVRKIVVQDDQKIIVGGNFTTFNSQAYSRLIRLNSNGSIDTSFATGTTIGAQVWDIAIQSDGKILVAGQFLSYNSVTVNRIMRLETNAVIDTTFSTGTSFNGTVRCLKIQPDGKILAGGSFSSYNGTTSNRIIRLNSDGTIDTTFSIGTGFTGDVYDIEIDVNGNILVCGDFQTYNGVSRNRLVRLSPTGELDNSLIIGFGFNFRTRRVYPNSDGSMYVLGNFSIYRNTDFRGAIKLLNNGDIDYSFNTGYGVTTSSGNTDDLGVHDMLITSDNKIVLTGSIYGYKGQESTYVVGMNKNGDVNQQMRYQLRRRSFANGDVRTVFIQSNGMVLIGGRYSSANVGKLEILDINWNRYGFFSVSFNSGFSTAPESLQVDSLGRIIMVGSFTTVNSVSRNNIARVLDNGTLDTSFVVGTGFSSQQNIVRLQQDGKILVGGFAGGTYNGQTYRGLIRLNDDGSIDNTFLHTAGNISVRAIYVQSDGKILVGGDFTSYNGVSIAPSNSLIRLNPDGTRDMTFIAPNMRVTYDIIETSDGKILVAGGSNVRVTKLNQDGSIDTSFTSNFNLSGSEQVRSIVEFSDGKIGAGGLFSSVENILCRNFAILNPNGSYTKKNTSVNFLVNSLAIKN